MTALTALWLPILVSAVIVFIASSIIHMTPLWHRNDFPRLPNQDAVMDALRPLNLPQGEYFVPRARDMKEMRTPEFQQQLERGPVVRLTVMPNRKMSMARPLTLWFIYIIVVSFFSAYIAGRALAPSAHYLEVFRFVGAAAFIGYALALWQMSIWDGRSWGMTIKSTIDGLIFALLTAGTFGWLWPR